MMSKKRKSPFPINDDVDRALLEVHKAACKLVAIAAANSDAHLVEKATWALGNLGAQAVLPVAWLIEHVPSASRRLRLVKLLRDIPPLFDIDHFLVLMRVSSNDPSEEVREAAWETLQILRERSHNKTPWPGTGEAGQATVPEEAGATTVG